MPMLSIEDVQKENLCLKKRKELIDNGVLPENLKKWNFELFNDGKKVLLNDEKKLTILFEHAVAEYAQSLQKFLKAVISGQYHVICLCETWLAVSVEDCELKTKRAKILSSCRTSNRDHSIDGGSLIAVKNTLDSKEVDIELSECCVACPLTLVKLDFDLCTLCNLPDGSK